MPCSETRLCGATRASADSFTVSGPKLQQPSSITGFRQEDMVGHSQLRCCYQRFAIGIGIDALIGTICEIGEVFLGAASRQAGGGLTECWHVFISHLSPSNPSTSPKSRCLIVR